MKLRISIWAFVLGVLGIGIFGWHSVVLAEDGEASKLMTEAARNFVVTLNDAQRAKAMLPFEDEKRYDWHYIPKPRKGLPFKDLDRAQSFLAEALLNSALSARGSMKVNTIMSLEMVLRDIETRGGDANAVTRRDPDLYYFTFFGEPSAEKPWGWSIEGHHLSLNFTLSDGRTVSSSPTFLGANPHEVPDGPRKGLRVLGAEEDLARDLMKSLDDSQKKQALLDANCPGDIFTKNSRKAELEGPPKGLPRSAMNDAQKQKLQALLDEYINNLQPYLADQRRAKIQKMTPEEWDQVYFAWMGWVEKGEPQYYRVQAPGFLIEYDNIKNPKDTIANHSHTVWRDWKGDWGLDYLAEHHKADH